MTYSKTFNVVGTNPYQCDFHPGNMAGTITVNSALSTAEELAFNNFSLGPNPANSFIKLNIPSQINIDGVRIYDILGKEVYSKAELENQINISKFSKGMYLLKVSSEGKTKTKRFIKL